MRPTIVLIGGFLGAGKTTLILAAAWELQRRGLRPAAILNDQGDDLVDTRFASANGIDTDQVAGGCFCCRFSDFADAAIRLREHSPDVIFAEAVGSCTDISATTIHPLRLGYGEDFRVAPYTVVVDPKQARAVAAEGPASDWSFLFHNQIAEADLICFNKVDRHSDFPDLRGAPLRYISALTGQGVAAWLDEILAGEAAGARILDIDYERYARAEASLAWLNCRTAVTLETPLSPASVAGPLLDGLDAALSAAGFQIAHLKIMDETPSGYVKVSLTGNHEAPSAQGMLDASPSATHDLLLNIRAGGDPETLRRLVEQQLSAIPGAVEVPSIACFRPAPPKPERRTVGKSVSTVTVEL